MKKLLTISNPNLTIVDWVWFSIWFTLPLSIRLNSISILLGSIILFVGYFRKSERNSRKRIYYLMLPILLFIVYTASIYDELFNLIVLKELEQMLPLVIIPIMFLLGSTDKESTKQVALSAMVISLSIAGVVMIAESVLWFINSGSFLAFTYHELALPFNSGAIYMSFFILVTLLQINELTWFLVNKRVRNVVIVFFLMLLLMLASKLMIITGGILLTLKYYKNIRLSLKRRKVLIPIVVIMSLLLIIPLGIRLKKISNPDLDIVFADKYTYDSPLNGLNLRLIQLRMGVEILNDNNAWLFGVGIDKSQEVLNNKYIKYGIYTGYVGTEDTGYLGYNFHNQFMETLVRVGLLGTILLIVMIIALLFIPQEQRIVSNWVIIVIFMFFLTESVMERQQGIVYFCLIYSSYFPLISQSNR